MSGPVYRGETLAQGLVRRYAERTLKASLRDSFRRVVWAGSTPRGDGGAPPGGDGAATPPRDPAPGRPLVVYANHHVYADSFLLWWLLTRVLHRPMIVWMEAWEQAPLFGPVGALPFPKDDGRERARTMRETARRMSRDPRTALYVYPEGSMGVPEAGLRAFRADLPRLARVLPDDAAWWPVAVGTSWWGESRPTALLAGGAAHDAPDGDERDRLQTVLDTLRDARPSDLETGQARVLLDGKRGADERWDLSRTAPLFRRITFGR